MRDYGCLRCGTSLINEWDEGLRQQFIELLRLDLSGPFGDLEFEEWRGYYPDDYCEWCNHVAEKA